MNRYITGDLSRYSHRLYGIPVKQVDNLVEKVYQICEPDEKYVDPRKIRLFIYENVLECMTGALYFTSENMREWEGDPFWITKHGFNGKLYNLSHTLTRFSQNFRPLDSAWGNNGMFEWELRKKISDQLLK